MSDIFPKWTNKLPATVLLGLLVLGGIVSYSVYYYFGPAYSRVGYQPVQPVSFSHSIHADQLGIDCRYCHDGVEKSWFSNIPSSNTCMNCHNQILSADPKLELVRESYNEGTPIKWVQIHKTPDYVYFNHAVHVNRGVSCVHCHGEIHKMDEVYHAKSFSMGFCLECHREPEKKLRHPDDVYNLDLTKTKEKQLSDGTQFVHDWNVNSSQNCSACHR